MTAPTPVRATPLATDEQGWPRCDAAWELLVRAAQCHPASIHLPPPWAMSFRRRYHTDVTSTLARLLDAGWLVLQADGAPVLARAHPLADALLAEYGARRS